MAARFSVPLRVRSTFRQDGDKGTLITRKERGMEDLALTGIASDAGYARIVLRGLPAGMDPVTRVLGALAARGVSVDMVSQSEQENGRRLLQLSVKEAQLETAQAVVQRQLEELGGERMAVQRDLSRLTLVGSGMTGRPGVYAQAYRALSAAGVEVHGLSTSAISIALLVERTREDDALRALHADFALDRASA